MIYAHIVCISKEPAAPQAKQKQKVKPAKSKAQTRSNTEQFQSVERYGIE